MNNQLGILVNDMLPSELFYYVQKGLTKAISDNYIKDATILYINQSSIMCHPKFSVCHVVELCGFKGDCIATSITGLMKLLKAVISGQKYYYIDNLEWLHLPAMNASQLMSIFRQPSIKYICRSETHARLIENNFNRRPDYIIEDFDLSPIYGK